jgi:flagellar protein FliL
MAGQDAKKSGGLMELLVPLVAVTALGGGGGWFLGASALAPRETVGLASGRDGTSDRDRNDGKPAAKGDHGAGAHGGEAPHGVEHGKAAAHDRPEALQSKELPAIVTNLSGGKSWVRLQAALIFDPHELKHAETLIPELMSDLTAFISTLELRDIEGSDGLRRLQEELNERARIRSEGHVREFIVESLVVQ